MDFGPDAKAAVPDLVKRLFDSHASVRSASAEALGRIGPGAKDAAPALLTLLEGDEPAFVQSAACEALGLIEPADKEAVVAVLKQKLEHPGPLVRAHAALALFLVAGDKTGKDEAARGLIHRMHHVRITAAEALWRMSKDVRSIPLLIRALEESNLTGTENENERYMAVRALGRIGADAKAAVPELLKLIGTRDPDLAATARAALKAIDPEAAKNAGVK
jgi:HEAT repeat protein